jgi:hypothetical protein
LPISKTLRKGKAGKGSNIELQVQLYYFNKLNLAMVYPTFLPNLWMESLKI